jgi:hypothetical protein
MPDFVGYLIIKALRRSRSEGAPSGMEGFYQNSMLFSPDGVKQRSSQRAGAVLVDLIIFFSFWGGFRRMAEEGCCGSGIRIP